jgi:hypothetical protein
MIRIQRGGASMWYFRDTNTTLIRPPPRSRGARGMGATRILTSAILRLVAAAGARSLRPVGACGRRGRDDGSVRGNLDGNKSKRVPRIRKMKAKQSRSGETRAELILPGARACACACSGVHAHRGGEGGGAKREGEEAKNGNAAHCLYLQVKIRRGLVLFLSLRFTIRPIDD